jgi:excisionase family DNA binding protein
MPKTRTIKKPELLSAGEVAAHCRVSYEAVKHWVQTGKLKAFTTPGGHRRVRVEDFQEFLRKYRIPQPEEAGAHKRRVLIVDDDPAIVQMLTKFFGKIGDYEVATAEDGFDAGIQMAAFRPNLVLLDLMMPTLDGFTVCRKIKSAPATRDIRVLVITGYPTDANIEKALECGADDCLAKPFKMGELKKRVEGLFQGAGRITALTG